MNHEIVKVNMKAIVEDEGRAIEVEFKHKARLKAQIMKDMLEDDREGDRFSYVRMPGTSKVAEVAFYDGEDQMMERNLNVAESKKVIDGERSGAWYNLLLCARRSSSLWTQVVDTTLSLRRRSQSVIWKPW